MAVNKVVYGSDTLVDLTSDSVTPATLAEGATAHGANGEQIVGLLKVVAVDPKLDESSENPVQNKAVASEIHTVNSSLTYLSNRLTNAKIMRVEEEFTNSTSTDVPSAVNTFTAATSGTTQRLRGIVYGNGYYVAVGHGGVCLYSTTPAGSYITVSPAYSSGAITGVAFGKGVFVSIDQYGAVFKASDPATWTQLTLPDDFTDVTLESVVFANGRFVIVGNKDSAANGFIAFTDDLENWEFVDDTLLTGCPLVSLTYGIDKYVAVSTNGSIIYSMDGSDWVDAAAGNTTYIRVVSFLYDKFVAGCQGGKILYSSDGITWSEATVTTGSTVSYIRGLAWANNTFYANCYTSGGTGILFSSADGTSWTEFATTTGRMWWLVEDGSNLLSVGDSGSINCMLFSTWYSYQPEKSSSEAYWHRLKLIYSDNSLAYTKAVRLKTDEYGVRASSTAWKFYLQKNGADYSNATINTTNASATVAGLVTTGTQTFAGDKTFTGNTEFSNTPTVGGNDLALKSDVPTIVGSTTEPPTDLSAYPNGTLYVQYEE